MTATTKKKPVEKKEAKIPDTKSTKFVGKKIGDKLVITFDKEKYSRKVTKEESEKIEQKIALYNKKPTDALKNQIVKLLTPKITETKEKKEKIEAEVKGYKKLAKKAEKEVKKEASENRNVIEELESLLETNKDNIEENKDNIKKIEAVLSKFKKVAVPEPVYTHTPRRGEY